MQTMNISDAQYLYIVFSSTPTKIGKAIRIVTRNTYNHVSISLDPRLQTMYSFSRYYKNMPLLGGFTEESLLRFRDAQGVRLKVCAIPLSVWHLTSVRRDIERFQSHPEHYIYNLFSFAAALFHRRIRVRDAYTCIEFAIYILTHSHIDQRLEPDRYYSIFELERFTADFVVYEGDSSHYPYPGDWGNDAYPAKMPSVLSIPTILRNILILLKRQLRPGYEYGECKPVRKP